MASPQKGSWRQPAQGKCSVPCLILMTVTGMIILLGGLLTYGLGVHEIIPVPRPDLIVVGTSLIGILLIVSGVCDLFVKKTKEMEIEENDERNISLSNAAMASGFKVMNEIGRAHV